MEELLNSITLILYLLTAIYIIGTIFVIGVFIFIIKYAINFYKEYNIQKAESLKLRRKYGGK